MRKHERGGLAPDANAEAPNVVPISEVAEKYLFHLIKDAKHRTRDVVFSSLVQIIEKKHKFARSSDGRLFVWKVTDPEGGGVYAPADNGWTAQEVREILEKNGKKGMIYFSQSMTREVEFALATNKPVLWDVPPAGQVNLLNGMMEVHNTTWHRVGSEWRSDVQLPIRLDRSKKCPDYDQFLASIFPADAIDLAWEIIGSCMVSDRFTQKAVWLFGEGENGKSTFILALKQLLGVYNTRQVSMKELSDDRFCSAELQGKLLMYDFDSSIEQVSDTHQFKKIVGGESVRAQRKGEHAFEFTPCCKVILAGNYTPDSKDTSFGYKRRIMIVPFEASFSKPELQSSILARLADPDEMSGAFNKAMEGLERLSRNQAYSEPGSVRKCTKGFMERNDPIGQFVREFLEKGVETTPCDEIEQEYQAWALEHGRQVFEQHQITKWFGSHMPEVVKIRPGSGEDRQYCYRGIKFKPASQ